MKNDLRQLLSLFFFLLFLSTTQAQLHKDRRIALNEDGSQYFKFTFLSQVWVRHTELNPGTLINGYAKDQYTDIGIRRARIQAYGQIADRVFLYTQFGMNNFNYLSDRKAGFFIHDVLGEYEVVRRKLSLGTGLTAWSGLARYAAPSAGSIMGIDAPLFEQNTNDVTDQFLRKLSVYAKGKLGKLDYRLIMSSPMAIQKSPGYNPVPGPQSNFSSLPPKMQWHGYFQYQFLDEESNLTPYSTGTYLGSKKVFNIGAGFQYQKEAMWQKQGNSDTTFSALNNFAADIYYDAPLKGRKAISVYGVYMRSGFGSGYLRNLGPMNPANGNSNSAIINGGGNNYPAFGTGDLVYAQAGLKLRDSLVGSTTFMPYASLQWAKYDRLVQPMTYWDAGVNWLLKGHNSKLTLSYQSRPVYRQDANTPKAVLQEHKGAVLLQYQVFLN